MIRKFKSIASTVGDGLWSGIAKPVRIIGIGLGYLSWERDHGELRIYFDRRTWNTDVHGLIYTDTGFLEQFRASLMAAGFSRYAVNDIHYSEQGMQSFQYVSCDVGKRFLNQWMEKSWTLDKPL